MLGDTSKVLKGFKDAGYQVVLDQIEVDCEDLTNKKQKKKTSLETGWRVLTRESQCVGVVMPTPAPKKLLGKLLCFGEPWYHTETETVTQESGHDAVYAAERIIGGVGRGGVFHGGKVWHAGNGNSIKKIL